MAKSVNSIDTIKNKIISEAREYEQKTISQAKEDAEKISLAFDKKASEAKERIISAAQQSADGIVSAAQSSQNMRSRNSLLSVKVDLIEKAYESAVEKITQLSKQEYLSIFSGYLKNAAENARLYEGKATLYVGKASPVTCEELLDASEKTDAVKALCAGGTSDREDAGFYLVVGDITLDCSAKTLVYAIKSNTQNGVAKLLFAQN